MPKTVGEMIRAARKAREPAMGLREFAAAIGKSASMTCVIERGGKEPSAATLSAMCAALGVEPEPYFQAAGMIEDCVYKGLAANYESLAGKVKELINEQR